MIINNSLASPKGEVPSDSEAEGSLKKKRGGQMNLKKIKKMAGAALMSLVLAVTMTASPVPAYASTGVSPFTGTTYTHSSANEDKILVHGVDVSAWQSNIDWEKAKAAGVDFAIIRIGFRGYGAAGNMQPDEDFITNIEGAKAAGIMVGVYFFSQALNTLEARAEANYTLKLLGDYELDLPIFMDYEFSPSSAGTAGRFRSGVISKIRGTACARAFCEVIEEAGYEAGIYANKSFLNSTIDGEALGQDYTIWVAHWVSTCTYSHDYDYWQYSSSGSVGGISGRCDVNYWYLDRTSDVTSSSSLANADITISSSSASYYSGIKFEPSVTVRLNGTYLTEGIDYTVSYINNSRAGTGYVMVKGKGTYTDYKLESFTIQASSDLSGITIKQPKDRKYTGSETKPSYITVTDALGNKLIENLDYTYSVKNAVNVGQATLNVNFCGNYTGTKSTIYNIVASTAQSITVSDARTSTNMSEGAYSLGASATYDNAALTYSSSNTDVATVSSSGKVTPKAEGETTITIKAAATSSYAAASKTITLTVINDIPEPTEEEIAAEEAKNARITAGVESTKVVCLKAPVVESKKVKLTWKKSNSGYRVDSYQIWRSTKKSSGYQKIFTSSNATNKYYVNTKGLEPGTTYWYKVRGVRVVDGKNVYTPFTKIQVTTKE